MSSALSLIYLFDPQYLLFRVIFWLPFYFLLPIVVLVSQVSTYLYIPDLVVGLTPFSFFAFVLWVPFFGLLLALFEPIYLFII